MTEPMRGVEAEIPIAGGDVMRGVLAQEDHGAVAVTLVDLDAWGRLFACA